MNILLTPNKELLDSYYSEHIMHYELLMILTECGITECSGTEHTEGYLGSPPG